MEDTHIAIPSFSNYKLGLFAVFDGHGGTIKINLGPATSIFVKKYFAQELLSNTHFKKGKY